MEVILLERIGKLGQMGDVVRVKDGYARNFLLPRGKALRATEENRNRFESMKSDLAGQSAQRQLNVFRAVLAGVSLWFTLQRRWSPPYKWLTQEIERLEMRPDTRGILEGALLNPSIDTLTHLRDHLKTEMKYAGIGEMASREALLEAFAATFHPDRAAGVYRSHYL